MVRVVIYGEKPTDIEGLEKMLREILTENRRWPMIHTYISDLESLPHYAGIRPGQTGSGNRRKNPGKQPGGVLDLAFRPGQCP